MRLHRNYVVALFLLTLMTVSNVTQTHAIVSPIAYSSVQQLPVGHDAVNFTITSLKTGATLNLSLYAGKLLLLDLFATWCVPCIMAIKDLKPIYTSYLSGGKFEILSVDVDTSETVADINSFVKTYGVPWDYTKDSPSAINGSQYIDDIYGSKYIPTLTMIWNNSVVYTEIGFDKDAVVSTIVKYIGNATTTTTTTSVTNSTTNSTTDTNASSTSNPSLPISIVNILVTFAILPLIIRRKQTKH